MKNYGFYLAVIVNIFTQNFVFASNQQSVDLKFENVKEVSDTLFDRTTDGQIDQRTFGDKKFVCDLNACKGECCVAGDSGAPLDKSMAANGLVKAMLLDIVQCRSRTAP